MPNSNLASFAHLLDCDASDTGYIARFCDLSQQLNLSGDSLSVLKRLSKEDIKKMAFLSLNFIPQERYSLITQSETGVSLLYLLQFISTHISDLEDYVKEFLFTIKKYRFLRDLGMCKHQAKVVYNDENKGKISCFWKMLFFLSEELEENSLIQLHKLCYSHKEIEEVCLAEDFFFKLWCDKRISEKNVSLLITCLEQIGSDLAKIVKTYQTSLTYFIKTPSINNPCGLAIIINQEEFNKICPNQHLENLPELHDRKGSSIDCDRLDATWKTFGFSTEIKYNLTSKDLLDYFKEVSSRDFERYDVFVACILSHGEKGKIFGSDRIPVKIDDLVFPFAKGRNSLIGKPKLFFFQACQTEQGHKGDLPNKVQLDVSSDNPFDSEVPDLCDVLWAMSTVPEYASFRHEQQGSFYISELTNALEKSGNEEDIDSILRTVNRHIAEKKFPYKGGICKQMPEWKSTLRYKLQLKRLQK